MAEMAREDEEGGGVPWLTANRAREEKAVAWFSAVHRCDRQSLESLLSARCDANLREATPEQSTALHVLASVQENIAAAAEISRWLVKDAGADAWAQERMSGATAAHLAASDGNTAALEVLLEHDITLVSAEDILERTPLHRASNATIAKYLIEHRADVDAVALNGWTPLHYAVWDCLGAVVNRLIDAGASTAIKTVNSGKLTAYALAKRRFVIGFHGMFRIKASPEEANKLILKGPGEFKEENQRILRALEYTKFKTVMKRDLDRITMLHEEIKRALYNGSIERNGKGWELIF